MRAALDLTPDPAAATYLPCGGSAAVRGVE